MKKILITGANSYIGMSFAQYLSPFQEDYRVDTLDMMGEGWKSADFSAYDAIYHVAGIAHIKETAENRHLYYEVNRDLVVETAKKAKESGVKQFVFLSTMAVYGINEGAISPRTVPTPRSSYGDSKLQAEEQLRAMEDASFKVTVLRPPMVYGEGCKGNYQSLIRIAEKLPIFADYKNKRSMIHIDNLSKFVKGRIDEEQSGLYLPQDPQYICTCKMIEEIARERGRKIYLTKLLNPAVSLFKLCTFTGKKAFGDLYYED